MKRYVTFEFTGCIEIEVDADDAEHAVKLAFEKIEAVNHTKLAGLGHFEYHDGEVVRNEGTPG